jgi:hypothetical protein
VDLCCSWRWSSGPAPAVSGGGRRSEQSGSGVPEEDEAGRCQGD